MKLDRLNRLNRIVNDVAEERAQRFIGRPLEVCDLAPAAFVPLMIFSVQLWCMCSSQLDIRYMKTLKGHSRKGYQV